MRVCDAKISTLYFFLLYFLIVPVFNVDCWHDELNEIKSSKKDHASRWLSLAESPGRVTTASATKKAYFLAETSAAMTLRAWCPAFTPEDRVRRTIRLVNQLVDSVIRSAIDRWTNTGKIKKELSTKLGICAVHKKCLHWEAPFRKLQTSPRVWLVVMSPIVTSAASSDLLDTGNRHVRHTRL